MAQHTAAAAGQHQGMEDNAAQYLGGRRRRKGVAGARALLVLELNGIGAPTAMTARSQRVHQQVGMLHKNAMTLLEDEWSRFIDSPMDQHSNRAACACSCYKTCPSCPSSHCLRQQDG